MKQSLCDALIGREHELALLEDALLAANRGDGGIALLAADAGMGKTRLARELAARAETLGFDVLWGSCSEAGLSPPHLPFVEAIGNWSAARGPEAVRAALGPTARELGVLFPQLGEEPPPAG